MKFSVLCAATGVLFASLAATAQPVDPMESPTPQRSRASKLKPPPRAMSPSEASTSIAAAGVSQPSNKPVVPQIAVPLGQGESTRAERTPYTQRAPSRADAAASASLSLDEAAASCEARAGEGMRAVCRDRVAKARNQR